MFSVVAMVVVVVVVVVVVFGVNLVVAADTNPVVVVICCSVGSINWGIYFHCINSCANIGCTFITVNIVAYVSGTAVNVTVYVIIFIYVIVGMGGGVGEWYIRLKHFILPCLVSFITT